MRVSLNQAFLLPLQVNKQGMSDRVVDEMNPEANLTWKDVSTLIQADEEDPPEVDHSDKVDNYTDPVIRYFLPQVFSIHSFSYYSGRPL